MRAEVLVAERAERAERIEVHGVVQGVGFRPFVHGLATELGLRGEVGNDSSKVFITVSGPAADVECFARRLVADPPPLARIDRVERVRLERPGGAAGFRIVESRGVGGPRTFVPPDTALCADCRTELFDPGDRRHRHPFITCTNCGPRFTIITDLPYDRPVTTMAGFPMCADCGAEYDDPTDRRYHAQPVCCHRCGPTLTFRAAGGHGESDGPDDPIEAAAAVIEGGGIVAVKGLGGYHLACDARSDRAVAELRRRKHRADKPFAVMVADVDQARELAEVADDEATLLTSPAAPIVLLRACRDSRSGSEPLLSPLVAPGNPLVGVMLAYTPVHLLLLDKLALAGRPVPLVMTSANRGGEPLAWTAERLAELGHLVDAVLDHDRPIHQPCDDSVVRVVGGRLLPIRRARGYAPLPVAVPSASGPVLAAGAELKNTFCLAADGQAWVSQHIGDMENLETLDAFEASVAHYLDLYRIGGAGPVGGAGLTVAADAHPGYLSSRWARRNHGDRVVEVQHHHAHVAAVMAEHQLDPAGPVIGFAFDGTGYGPGDDGEAGTIWGGEVLVATAAHYRRVAHLAPIPLPGGDAAVRQPARVALAHLHVAGIAWSGDDGATLAPARHLVDRGGPGTLDLLRTQIERGLNCVPTTSMGRLFDAVASLIGLRHEISFEAQAAIDLEVAAADGRDHGDTGYRFGVDLDHEVGVFDPAPVLRALLADRAAGTPTPTLAWRFHRAVVDAVERVAVEVRDRAGTGPGPDLDTVALSGGVFQNALLAELCVDALERQGFRALTHALVPPNDGGLALGQVYIVSNGVSNGVSDGVSNSNSSCGEPQSKGS